MSGDATVRWPQKAASPRISNFRPRPFQEGWGDGRPTSRRDAKPSDAPHVTRLLAENEELRAELRSARAENSRLAAALSTATSAAAAKEDVAATADALRAEIQQLHCEVAALRETEALLRRAQHLYDGGLAHGSLPESSMAILAEAERRRVAQGNTDERGEMSPTQSAATTIRTFAPDALEALRSARRQRETDDGHALEGLVA